MLTYSGAKAALIASIRSIAKEYATSKVRFNCVSPSDVNTPMQGWLNEVGERERNWSYPMGLGEVDDIASIIIFLLSDKAKWIAAQNYVVDCGVM